MTDRGLILVLCVVLAACTNKDNHLLSAPTELAVVNGPDEHILVESPDGTQYRVNLKNGAKVLMAPPSEERSIDGTVSVAFEGSVYVIHKTSGVLRVEGVPKGEPNLSPDDSRFYVIPKHPLLDVDGESLWVVEVDDGSVREFSLGPHDQYVRWSKDSRSIRYRHGPFVEQELVLESGEVRDATEDVEEPLAQAPGAGPKCHEHGFELEMEDRGRRATITLVAIPGRESSLGPAFRNLPRTLVTATSYSQMTHSMNYPDSLMSRGFSDSCTHHIFTVGRRIYVGNLATGAFAYIASGWVNN